MGVNMEKLVKKIEEMTSEEFMEERTEWGKGKRCLFVSMVAIQQNTT